MYHECAGTKRSGVVIQLANAEEQHNPLMSSKNKFQMCMGTDSFYIAYCPFCGMWLNYAVDQARDSWAFLVSDAQAQIQILKVRTWALRDSIKLFRKKMKKGEPFPGVFRPIRGVKK
jgi:hypothetical protein